MQQQPVGHEPQHQVKFELNNFSTLGCMVPPRQPDGSYGQASLPQGMDDGAYVYMILNINAVPHNRYIGISSNIQQRFNTRLATVVEMGFSQEIMNNIGVWWGSAYYTNVPNPNDQHWQAVNPQGNPTALTVNINNQSVNLERLLIRFVMTQLQPQNENTVSNTALNTPYPNPTGAPIGVTLRWGAAPQFNLQDDEVNAIWQSGENYHW
jgi:hypothetical protein